MSRKPRRKPGDAEARKRAKVEREMERARMEKLGYEVTSDKRTGEIYGAFRADVVTIMQRAGKIGQAEVDAVRGLEEMIYLATGESPCALAGLDRVSGGVRSDPSLVRVKAAAKLVERQERMDARTWAILRQLCDGCLISTRWPAVMFRLTGEDNDDAKKGIMREAFRVLASVEEAIVRDGQRRAA